MGLSTVKDLLLLTTVIVAGIISSAFLGMSIEASRPPLPEGFSDFDLSVHGARMKGFGLGMEGLIADWYYMRSLQYIGDKILARDKKDINLDDLRELNPRLLYPLLDNATSLDPNFLGAFYYGAVVLPAVDGDRALDLTLKGIEHNPDTWQLYQHLGYIYWKLGRFDRAGEAYETGSAKPGAPPFMRLMAGAMRTEGGSRDTARKIFQQMYDATDDPAVKITAERRIAQLNSLDEREAIDEALASFQLRNGRCPQSLREILPSLTNIRLPANNAFRLDAAGNLADPTGAPYVLDTEQCRTMLDLDRTALSTK